MIESLTANATINAVMPALIIVPALLLLALALLGSRMPEPAVAPSTSVESGAMTDQQWMGFADCFTVEQDHVEPATWQDLSAAQQAATLKSWGDPLDRDDGCC